MSLPDTGLPDEFSGWLRRLRENTPERLAEKARTLIDIIGSRVTVMPPDARHTDYNFIPLTIADGCLYKCAFCKIKNKKPFSVRSRADIHRQIAELKTLYGRDIINYNALFLGEHDALNAPADLILETLEKAHEEFGFASSYMKEAFLFIFGSADSFLNADPFLFELCLRFIDSINRSNQQDFLANEINLDSHFGYGPPSDISTLYRGNRL